MDGLEFRRLSAVPSGPVNRYALSHMKHSRPRDLVNCSKKRFHISEVNLTNVLELRHHISVAFRAGLAVQAHIKCGRTRTLANRRASEPGMDNRTSPTDEDADGSARGLRRYLSSGWTPSG
ncbi:hypothetical protein MTO96_009249 [Rhipicephalus appendiculatus]